MRRAADRRLVMTLGLAWCGCVSQEGGSRGEFRPISFPDRTAVPRVVVWGSVGDLLPEWDETPALERFLYGPNHAGKAVLRNPQGMAQWGDWLLVCDQGFPDLIAVSLATGKSRRWGDPNHPPRCPVDVAVGEDQRVYVADTTRRSVLVYDGSEKFLRELSPVGASKGTFRPAAVYAARGTLYIGNVGDRRLERFDLAAGTWLSPPVAPDGAAPIVAPTGVCVTPAGIVLVSDAIQGVVHRIAADGRWLAPIGSPGRGKGQLVRPKQVRCTQSGLVFVTDAGRQSVLVFTSDGGYLLEVGANGPGWNGFTLPMGLVAVDPARLLTGGQTEAAKDWAVLRAADECVIVSDSLGGVSLTVLGVVVRASEEGAHAG